MTMANEEGEAEKAADEIGECMARVLILFWSVAKSASQGFNRGLHGGAKE
jgi:hypothetical protein